MTAPQYPRRAFRPRGGVHVIVMGVAMIVAVMAAGALTVRRIERRLAGESVDQVNARLNALAAIEQGRLRVKQDPDWRANYASGTWFEQQTIGAGTCSLVGIDPVDNDLADDWLDRLELTGTGFAGSARQKISVTLQPRIVGIEALQVAAIGSTIMLDSADLTCDQTIAANRWVFASHSTVHADVEAGGSVWGHGYSGTVTEGASTRRLPDPIVVFDYYSARATEIQWADLVHAAGGRRVIERVLLSPTFNPYGNGATNSEGVYVVDCGGSDLKIRDCRLVGTLVVLNAGSGTELSNSFNGTPAVPNYPTILVDGPFQLELRSSRSLTEAGDPSVNFNPSGAPFDGTSDNDTTDEYATEIRGFVYASGNVTLRRSTHITGLLIAGGELAVTGSPELVYASSYLADPPPGFQMTLLDPVSGSWHQSTD